MLERDGLLASNTAAATAAESRPRVDLLPRDGHFPARAKNVIMLFQSGAPSQMDLFDPKPLLNEMDGIDNVTTAVSTTNSGITPAINSVIASGGGHRYRSSFAVDQHAAPGHRVGLRVQSCVSIVVAMITSHLRFY